MPTFSRRPCLELAPWVQLLWATHSEATQLGAPYRERVLPTGSMHVVLRLSDAPLTLFDDSVTAASRTMGHLIVGGARSGYYVKQAGDNACSVGVQLQPGAASLLLGVPAGELAEQHTSLDALWGLEAMQLRERLYDVGPSNFSTAYPAHSDVGLQTQVDLFESVLLERLRRAEQHERQIHWLTHTLGGLEGGVPLATLVADSGVSHRAFITRFRNMVGLSPKVFARVRRFQRVIASSHGARANDDGTRRLSLAQLAFDAGYADQAHLSRDFLEFAGVTPTAYARLAPAAANHVRVP